MLRSMYSGVSGLKNFQTKLDVIGNNIANVNTFGFKKGRVTFKDAMSQTIGGATGSSDAMGGVNAKQVGLGAQLATIDTVHEAGSTQTTNRLLDLAIQGDGYFQVQRGEGGETLYTRSANLYFDNFDGEGRLVTGSGEFVLNADNEPIVIEDINEVTNISIGSDGRISYVDADGELINDEDELIIGVVRFANNSGLEAAGNNQYRASANSGEAVVANEPGVEGVVTIQSGTIEMSNVDLAEEFTEMIIAQRGFQANTKIITTSDEILQELMSLKR